MCKCHALGSDGGDLPVLFNLNMWHGMAWHGGDAIITGLEYSGSTNRFMYLQRLELYPQARCAGVEELYIYLNAHSFCIKCLADSIRCACRTSTCVVRTMNHLVSVMHGRMSN